MMATLARISLCAALLVLASSAASAQEWGTLTGRFVYDGKPPVLKDIPPTKDQQVCDKHKIPDERLVVDKDGGLANVVVTLATKGVQVAPSYSSAGEKPVELDNKNCRFEPHIAIVTTKQKMALRNSDPIGHNSNVAPLANPGINPILPVGGDPIPFELKAEEGLPVQVSCNIHPWMKAYIVVRSNPYAAVSDSTGKFTIKDLPAGKPLEFDLWQESAGRLKNTAVGSAGKTSARGRVKLTLKPGENNLGDIKVSPSLFKLN
jgi:hypothetical protein